MFSCDTDGLLLAHIIVVNIMQYVVLASNV